MPTSANVSGDAFRYGEEIGGAAVEGVSAIVAQAINQFFGGNFHAAPGSFGEAGSQLPFGCVIRRASSGIPIDGNEAVAVVIEIVDDLSIDALRAGYRKIATAKTVKKAPPTHGAVRSNTFGVLLTKRSALTIEEIATEVDRLNSHYPAYLWVDAVGVNGVGAVTYGVHFPSQQTISNLMLPGDASLTVPPPPIYVLNTMAATGAYTFNKLLSLVAGHLFSFVEHAGIPDFNAFLIDAPKTTISFTGYQYNLSGKLVPVPPQFYNDRYIPPRPFLIDGPDGKPLAAVQYLPWQDGAVILLRGKLPLDGLLVFLFKPGMQRILRLDDGSQLSYVLPLTHAAFLEWLGTIQTRSNFKVRNDPGRIIVQKYADEGCSSPFMARMFLGIMRLRDSVFSDADLRESFDKQFDFLVTSLMSAREAAKSFKELWDKHAAKIASGGIVEIQGSQLRVSESVDRELRKEFETFLNSSVRVLKTALDNLGKTLGQDIGFLFGKDSTFARRVAELQTVKPAFATYLERVRAWTGPVQKIRNELEHSSATLPRVTYDIVTGKAVVHEPQVEGKPVAEFVSTSYDRLVCFAEDFVVYCLQHRLPPQITISEIPLAQRAQAAPERFRFALALGGQPAWSITYSEAPFEQI